MVKVKEITQYSTIDFFCKINVFAEENTKKIKIVVNCNLNSNKITEECEFEPEVGDKLYVYFNTEEDKGLLLVRDGILIDSFSFRYCGLLGWVEKEEGDLVFCYIKHLYSPDFESEEK